MNTLNTRSSGVLMHITSLPGNTGIGTLGKAAYDFVDKLANSSQSYWQILPIGPTGYGDSPYQSFSTFAGNPYFIDFDTLVNEGYLESSDFENIDWGDNPARVDFAKVYKGRKEVFSILYENVKKKGMPDGYYDFCLENEYWLDDYALFMSIKDAHGGDSFSNWESDIKSGKAEAIKFWTLKCEDKIVYYKMLQYFFFEQWHKLKSYANSTGIKIIGDLPIYISADSCDVWSSPKQFCLDDDFNPIEVAGCPPDAFSAMGQLWGNPVYNWDYMKKSDYKWWKNRLAVSFKNYDVVRIDHFRGFEAYYCIPFGAPDASNGVWRKGPGTDFFTSLKKDFGDVPIIAEDLGFLTDGVRQMLKDVGFPGMKVLQFAFDTRDSAGGYLPHQYIKNSVVYTGTHDNNTIEGWKEDARKQDIEFALEYLRIKSTAQMREELMITALESVSNTCILTMQDLIGLGSSARMNIPSSVGTNWQWRALESQLKDESFKFLAYYSKLYGRNLKK